mgnify:CR=1 FL=1
MNPMHQLTRRPVKAAFGALLLALAGVWSVSYLCIRQYGKGMLGSLRHSARRLYRPLAAALLGGAFVGIGVGLIVRQGGSSGGDDALALVIHKLTGWKLSRAYLFTDLTVLVASLSYIPVRRIAFSLVTVTVSSLLIDWVKEYTPKNGKTNV